MSANFQRIANLVLADKRRAYSELSLEAALFMSKKGLVIRNTHTAQLRSLHYGRGDNPDTHSAGGGRYGIPLWTVIIPDLIDPNQSAFQREQPTESEQIAKKIKQYIGNRFSGRRSLLTQQSLEQLLPTEQRQHLIDFWQRVKEEHIGPYTALGLSSTGLFDYELVVAEDSGYYVSDFGRYATGARSNSTISEKTIAYRATFNAIEIAFLKSIIEGTYNSRLPDLEGLPAEVADSVRYRLGNQLATEIIAAKLAYFLNSCGLLKKVITLNKQILEWLLEQSLVSAKPDLDKIVQEGLVLYSRQFHPPKDYLESGSPKYPGSFTVSQRDRGAAGSLSAVNFFPKRAPVVSRENRQALLLFSALFFLAALFSSSSSYSARFIWAVAGGVVGWLGLRLPSGPGVVSPASFEESRRYQF